MLKPQILVICGPTASGKSRMGVEIALLTGGEVVSADSMQVYRGMDIGTAKPTPAEMKGVPHHMLSVADPGETYSAARYVREAAACTDDILSRGKLPIVVGGTGLYMDALTSGRHFAPFSKKTRAALHRRAEEEGVEALWEELRRADPARAEKLPQSDKKRIIRALEVWYETGRTLTEHDGDTSRRAPRYRSLYLGLSYADRAHLNSRIDARVDEMAAHGLEDEVRALLAAGVPRDCTSMQAIGYKEYLSVVEGRRPRAEALAEIKLRTRQYAKRQLTWFRRNGDIRWLLWGAVPDFSAAVQETAEYMGEFGLL